MIRHVEMRLFGRLIAMVAAALFVGVAVGEAAVGGQRVVVADGFDVDELDRQIETLGQRQ